MDTGAFKRQAQQDVIRPEPSGYELVLIKGGTFMMGSEERDLKNLFMK
jgi:formylglycine-generating enzyme required for sulfatase activity